MPIPDGKQGEHPDASDEAAASAAVKVAREDGGVPPNKKLDTKVSTVFGGGTEERRVVVQGEGYCRVYGAFLKDGRWVVTQGNSTSCS